MQTNKPFVGLHVDETQTSHANDTHVYCQVKPNGNRHTKKKVNIQTERRSHAGENKVNPQTKKNELGDEKNKRADDKKVGMHTENKLTDIRTQN